MSAFCSLPLALAVVAVLAVASPGQQTGKPPNVVLILADDLGHGDPRCYNDESRIPTPHLDRLATEGVLCTDAHSPSSVCSPTRYGILTGRYAWRTPLRRGVLWPWDPPLLEAKRSTLPELLRGRGYATACIGKWHLGWDWPLDADAHVTDLLDGHSWPGKRRAEVGARIDWSRAIRGGPLAHGFDHYFGDDVPNFPPYAFIEDDRVMARPTATKPAGMFGHPGPAAPGWDLAVVLPMLAQRATAWIDARAQQADQPFFLYLPLTAPHTPIAPSPRFAGASGAGAYGDYVCEVDWLVGEVMAALARGGFADQTLLVFTSDNGSPQRDGSGMSGPVGSVRVHGHDPSRPWRGLKSDAWEGGHRVPLLARWPGRIPAASRCAAPIVLTDLYRTIAAAAGAEVPAGAAEDSFDALGVLTGVPVDALSRDHLVHHSGGGVFAIRAGRWKLILGRGSGGFSKWKPPVDAPAGQLYDLVADPGERHNRYDEHADVVARLQARLGEIRDRGWSSPTGSGEPGRAVRPAVRRTRR